MLTWSFVVLSGLNQRPRFNLGLPPSHLSSFPTFHSHSPNLFLSSLSLSVKTAEAIRTCLEQIKKDVVREASPPFDEEDNKHDWDHR